MKPSPDKASRHEAGKDARAQLVELFYPVHYTVGLAIEDIIRAGVLTRKQAAILWLIRSEGRERRMMPRKEIERFISGWFELSNSEISKALRGMARPPLELIRIVESPSSGRERSVLLTAKGERFMSKAVANAVRFFDPVRNTLDDREAQAGIRFLEDAIVALEAAGGRSGRRKH
jgi:DNA-binding MarR family transcriptional regulator